MARPSTMPEWATSANYNAGPLNGQATRFEPTSGEKANGWWLNQKPPVRKFNWLLGLLCDWAKHLDESRVVAGVARYRVSTGGLNHGTDPALTLVSQVGGFTLASGEAKVPEPGTYLVDWSVPISAATPAAGGVVAFGLDITGHTFAHEAGPIVFPSSTAAALQISRGGFPVTIADPDVETIGITWSISGSFGDVSVAEINDGTFTYHNYLTITRVTPP